MVLFSNAGYKAFLLAAFVQFVLLVLGFYPALVWTGLVVTGLLFLYVWLIEPRLPPYKWQLPIKVLPKQNMAEPQHPAIKGWYDGYAEKTTASAIALLDKIVENLREKFGKPLFPVFGNLINVIRSAAYYADDSLRRSIDGGTFASDDIEHWRLAYARLVAFSAELSELVDVEVKSWDEYIAFKDHHNEMLSALSYTIGIDAFDNLRNDAESLSLRNHRFHYESDGVPLITALQQAYETVEDVKLGAEIREKTPTNSARTSYLLNTLEETDATLYGKRPPSTVARQIPRCEMRELTLVEGRSDLKEQVSKEVKFSDIYITQSDFRKFIEYMKRKSNEPMFDS